MCCLWIECDGQDLFIRRIFCFDCKFIRNEFRPFFDALFAEPHKDKREGPSDIRVQVQARIHPCWCKASVPWRQVQRRGRGHSDFRLPAPVTVINLATMAAPRWLVTWMYFPSVICKPGGTKVVSLSLAGINRWCVTVQHLMTPEVEANLSLKAG